MWVKNCIRHRLSLMGGDSYRNALLMIKGCYPQQRWSDCVCTGGKPRLRLLAEQTRQQRNQGDAYQSNAAASHELLHALRLCARIVIAVALHQIDYAPDTKPGSKCYNKGLQNVYCAIEKCHKYILSAASAAVRQADKRRSAYGRRRTKKPPSGKGGCPRAA